MTGPIRLGTRGSALARTQSQTVADSLAVASGRPVELVIIKTVGDVTAGPLASMPQPGVFVSALRTALLDGDVDVVVHSMKDLPSEPADGIALAAVPPRADPHDALVSANRGDLDALPNGARVGTSSPRRAARLRSIRPDLAIEDLRGNVDSRIAKVRDGQLDATILAVAGLTRLGRADEIDAIIDMGTMLAAPAQGALAVECRSHDVEMVRALSALDDTATRVTTTAERAVLSAVGATCASAVGAHASWVDGRLTLVADVSGRAVDQHVIVASDVVLDASGPSAVESARQLGGEVGRQLLDAGAGAFITPESAGA
ncbi:MAG: hydroxymethylbilane synthase [Actinomycetes bacterium]